MRVKVACICCALLFFASCAAPKVINQSGKVAPKGNIVAGASYTANVPTKTIALAGGIVERNITDLINKDSITLDKNTTQINKAAIAYAIDPLGSGYDFYLRAGVATRFELGYKLAGKTHTFYSQYQFLGPTGQIGEKNDEKFYGSIGLQYSWQSYKLPSIFGEMQSRLGYEFSRRDFLLPVLFSISLGDEEEYGALSFGMAAAYTRIKYSTYPDNVYDDNGKPVFSLQHKQGFLSYGLFFNAKLGYRYIYVIPALSIFYQNYGNFKLINGENFQFKGFTLVPSLSVQLSLGNFEKNPIR